MNFYNPLIEQAIELSAQWHDGTYRKGRWREPPFTAPEGEAVRVPVMAHVTAVALTVQRAGWEDEVVAAAFLHDVIEDENRYRQNFRRELMRDLVGDAVTGIVETLTEQKCDAEGNFRPWQDRKDDYIEQLRNGSAGAVAISLADKLHNLWSMNESLKRDIGIFTNAPNRRALSAGPNKQLWFYNAVLEASRVFSDSRLDPMRERLQEEIDRFARLTAQAVE